MQCLYAPSLHLVSVDLVLPSLHPSTFLQNVSFTFIHSIAYNKIIDEHRAVNQNSLKGVTSTHFLRTCEKPRAAKYRSSFSTKRCMYANEWLCLSVPPCMLLEDVLAFGMRTQCWAATCSTFIFVYSSCQSLTG